MFTYLLSLWLSLAASLVPTSGHDHNKGGRCTGSAYCTACKNCSRCAHCAGGGGTCGVCAGSSSGASYGASTSYYATPRRTSTRRRSTARRSASYTNYTNVTLSAGQHFARSVVNVRQGPGTDYPVVTQLEAGQTVTVDRISNGWAHVTLDDDATEGYVKSEYLQ